MSSRCFQHNLTLTPFISSCFQQLVGITARSLQLRDEGYFFWEESTAKFRYTFLDAEQQIFSVLLKERRTAAIALFCFKS